MLNSKEIEAIRKSLEKGYDVLIRPKKDEIQIIEQKPKVIGRTDKSKALIEIAELADKLLTV